MNQSDSKSLHHSDSPCIGNNLQHSITDGMTNSMHSERESNNIEFY